MSIDREAEVQRLSEADQHIANAERAISEQVVQLESLRRDGHDMALAERTLRAFEDTLQTLREHRELIISTIEQIDKGLA
jgi:hypothetical protein